jgi:hypothetical protein
MEVRNIHLEWPVIVLTRCGVGHDFFAHRETIAVGASPGKWLSFYRSDASHNG